MREVGFQCFFGLRPAREVLGFGLGGPVPFVGCSVIVGVVGWGVRVAVGVVVSVRRSREV